MMIEIWFPDEARIGQKNKITRRWAKRGSRPSAPHDQRTRSADIFGAICPQHGKAAALVMPWCDTHAMNRHLIEIARNVTEDGHAIPILDQAGWHMSNNLVVPENITILPLPPKSPELNPVENIWQFMRDNWLSNRIFKSYEDTFPITLMAAVFGSLKKMGSTCSMMSALTSRKLRLFSIGISERFAPLSLAT
jgi:transposase